jgi:hypothetical protein
MGESTETMVLVLGDDVLGRHRLGALETKVLRYIMQLPIAYRFLYVLHDGDGFKYESKMELDQAKKLDSIYYEIPFNDLAAELDVDPESIAAELRVVLKHLTQNVFITTKRGTFSDSLTGFICSDDADNTPFAQVDEGWYYQPLFTGVELTKHTLIVDMRGSVLNLLLTADMDQFSDNRFRSIYSQMVNNAIYHHLGVDPHAKDNLVEGLNSFRLQVDIDELRRWTKTVDKYIRYSQFKERVLDVAVKEITTWGDYSLGYNPVKAGNKITAVEFVGTLKEDAKKGFREGLLILNGTQSDMVVMRALLAQQGIHCTPEEAYELHQLYKMDSVRYFRDDLDFVVSNTAEQTLKLMEIDGPYTPPGCYIEHPEGEVYENLIICNGVSVERDERGKIKHPLKYLKQMQINRIRDDMQKKKESLGDKLRDELRREERDKILAELDVLNNPLADFQREKGYFDNNDDDDDLGYTEY